jgi:hypothetical protein
MNETNGKSATRLVRSALVNASGQRMTYEGPAIAFVDGTEPLGLRVAILCEKAIALAGAAAIVADAVGKATQEPRHVLIVWRIPQGSAGAVLTMTAQLVARIQKQEKIHAVIVDDGDHAWHLGVEDLAHVRKTIDSMLRAEPDAPRVIAVL